jgi:tRNA C32,U32 (ribose-2'-O)-methylase TrmJ
MSAEAVSAKDIERLEKFRDYLSVNDPQRLIGISVNVVHVPLSTQTDQATEWGRSEEDMGETAHHEQEKIHFEHGPSILDLLEAIAHRPLKDQVIILANLLTSSGFSQAEISEALGFKHQYYRNRILEMRKEFKKRTI